MIYNILDFGAKGDGISKDSIAIQAAINECAKSGGGTVVIPSKTFLCGTLCLKSNVNIYLEPGATIISSAEQKDLLSGALLEAEGVHNIGIMGLGIIDGQGDKFMEQDDGVGESPLMPSKFRPQLLRFKACNNVHIADVTFKKSANWTLHLIGCSKVNIRGIKILNNIRGPNNDGIDPVSCKDVHISDCHIESGDDAICLKTDKYAANEFGSCENVTVSNCTLISRSTAIKIGTGTYADIRNCVFQNCVIRDSNRGIGIWVRDGAIVENIVFSNIVIETRRFEGESNPPGDGGVFPSHPRRSPGWGWWGKGEPIFISAERRNMENPPGKIRNVLIHNIVAEAEGCIYIAGCPESVIEGVTLDQIRLLIRKRSKLAVGLFDTNPSLRGVFFHDIPGIFCEYIRDLRISDVQVSWGENLSRYYTNAFYGENIDDLIIKGFKGKSAYDHLPVIKLCKVRGLFVGQCTAIPGTDTFLSLKEVDTDRMFIVGNDFSKAKNPIILEGGSGKSARREKFFASTNKMP